MGRGPIEANLGARHASHPRPFISLKDFSARCRSTHSGGWRGPGGHLL